MSELQIALVGLGGVLVVCVWAYNLWQTRKHRRHAEAVLPKTEASDVLMAERESDRREPAIENAIPREPTFVPAREAALDAVATDADGALKSHAPLPAEWGDGRVDCLLRLEFVDIVPAAQLWAEQAIWSGAIDKPLQWLGLDGNSGRWRGIVPQDPGGVSQLAVALQLVDRRGPLSESTLGTFLGGVHQLAQRFSGLVELPEQAPVLARARELDTFCASLDLQLSLHVLPRAGSLNEMLGAKLKPVIEAAGLRLEGERFVAFDGNGAELFVLTCQSATPFLVERLADSGLSGVTFSLDVPRVTDGLGAFDRMIALAQQCAEVLGGQLADAHKNPLTEATINALRPRIGELQTQMTQAGFAPGSVRALRLFS